MSNEPSYLHLLNRIAHAESAANQYLSAWADTTTNEELQAVLRKVALREGEHGMSFAKRINELGYTMEAVDDPNFERRMAVAVSDMADVDKVEALDLLKLFTGDGPDVFDGMFRDHSIDIETGALLGRYIAEERDTVRLLQGCHAALQAGACPAPDSDDRIAALDSKLDGLCRAVDELRQIVCAQSMPAATT